MDIRNATQFSNFVKAAHIESLDMAFQQVVMCVNNYAGACNCWKAEVKQRLYDDCTRKYMDAVRNAVPRLKSQILDKTSDRQITFFLDNRTVIGLICR